MNRSLKYIALLAIIPLFTAGLTTDYFTDANAAKGKGVKILSYGSDTNICGLQLCSEILGGKAAWMEQKKISIPVIAVMDDTMMDDTMMDDTMMDDTMMDDTMMDDTMMDDTMMDDTMMDDTMMDDTMMDDTMMDDTMMDDTMMDDTMMDDTMMDDTMMDDTMMDDTMMDDTMMDDTMMDDTMMDDTMMDDTMMDDTMMDDTMMDDTMMDDTMMDDTMMDDTMMDDTMMDDTMMDDTMMDDTMMDDTMMDDTMMDDTMMDDTMMDDTMMDDTMMDDTMMDDTMMDDTMMDDTMMDDTMMDDTMMDDTMMDDTMMDDTMMDDTMMDDTMMDDTMMDDTMMDDTMMDDTMMDDTMMDDTMMDDTMMDDTMMDDTMMDDTMMDDTMMDDTMMDDTMMDDTMMDDTMMDDTMMDDTMMDDTMMDDTMMDDTMMDDTMMDDTMMDDTMMDDTMMDDTMMDDTMMDDTMMDDTMMDDTMMDDTMMMDETTEADLDSVLRLSRANVPAVIPLHQGYYDGEDVYFIITDSSDPAHAKIITENQGWQVELAPLLANAPDEALSKIYIFTNGVVGDGIHEYQGEVFTSTPAQTDTYSALTSHVHVTWNESETSRILDSDEMIMKAVENGEITLTNVDVILNMPQIIWPEGQMMVKEDKTLTDEQPYGGGQVLDIDTEEMNVTFIAHRGWGPDGRTIYYIVTDATPSGPAELMGVVSAPTLSSLITNSAAVDLFQFKNGITGSGPLGFQAGIATSAPNDANYSPIWRISGITWENPDDASLLQTLQDISAFQKAGLVSTTLLRPMDSDHIVNCPFIDPFQ